MTPLGKDIQKQLVLFFGGRYDCGVVSELEPVTWSQRIPIAITHGSDPIVFNTFY